MKWSALTQPYAITILQAAVEYHLPEAASKGGEWVPNLYRAAGRSISIN
jgi:hypothetical protein